MSFILDALRKSETERRRTATPMLAGVPVDVGRPGIPGWTWAVIVLLAVAVIALGGAWWNSIRDNRGAAPLAATPPPAANQVTTGSAPTDGLPAAAPVTTVPSLTSAAPVGADARIAADRPGPASDRSALVATAETAPATATTIPPPSPPSATEPALTPTARSVAGNVSANRSSLPTYAEARAGGMPLPDLRLELHVYHSDASARWVYINGTRYTEGRRIAEGPSVAEIVPEGVVLSQDGGSFLLLAQ